GRPRARAARRRRPGARAGPRGGRAGVRAGDGRARRGRTGRRAPETECSAAGVTMRAMPSRVRYERLATERVNPRSRSLDRLSPRVIAALMNREDRRAVAAVGRVAPAIGAAVERIVASLARGGRLVFVGAGTSGRLGVLEAAECPPTFGTPRTLVQAIMAGGRASVFRSREGAEDDARAA